MMKNKKAVIIITSVLIIILIVVGGRFISAGSFEYAQKYQFNIDQGELTSIVKQFKIRYPQYNQPAEIYAVDSLDVTNNHFNVFIYDKNNSRTFGFFITSDSEDKRKSSINLVSTNDNGNINGWKIVNRDLSRKENIKVKQIFENSFLKKLQIPYENEGNGMLVFWK